MTQHQSNVSQRVYVHSPHLFWKDSVTLTVQRLKMLLPGFPSPRLTVLEVKVTDFKQRKLMF